MNLPQETLPNEDGKWSYITYVYKNNELISYVDGVKDSGIINDIELKNYNIILNGIIDEPGTKNYIDDIYVYNTALTEKEVANLFNQFQKENASTYDKHNWMKTSDDSFSYYTIDGKVIGTFHKNYNVVDGDNDQLIGWYYVSSTNKWKKNIVPLNTAKTFEGIRSGVKYYYGGAGSKQVSPYSSGDEETKIGSSYSYEPTTFGPLKFFIDKDGNLCCFYNSGQNEDGRYGWSYVYEKKDEDRLKMESLQHALGLFVTKLEEESPSSQVSAVRFSSGDFKEEVDSEKLVILDWTNDAEESAGMLSLNRGVDFGGIGSMTGYTTSANNIDQYNYVLTGHTSTVTGLQAYRDNLDSRLPSGEGSNYLIIFTDGKDTDLDSTSGADMDAKITNSDAVKIAKELREGEHHYTIFTVMLAGGSVAKEENEDEDGKESDYEIAVKFLTALTGDEERSYVGTNTADLVNIFAKKILDDIADDLNNYAIQDYIDPRFNLVDADGAVWKLEVGAETSEKTGQVTILRAGESPEVVSEADLATGKDIILSSDEALEGPQAKLYFDSEKGMYYLKWVDQIIPGCSEGAGKLAVWNARVTVQAKEDFIGGNAVMTNGNAALENYVYDPSLVEASEVSSGIDKMYEQEVHDDETDTSRVINPSKGFPRTTVNVKVPQLEMTSGEQVIFMGENLTSDGVAENLGKTIKDWLDNGEETPTKRTWYWSYLKRYAAYKAEQDGTGDKSTDDYFQEFLQQIVTEKTKTFDYFYIPDYVEGKTVTQTGDTEHHELDKLGTLTFTWVNQADISGAEDTNVSKYPGDIAEGDIITRDTNLRRSALTVMYKPLTVTGESENRVTYNQNTVQNEKTDEKNIYGWDPERKPAAGDEQTFNKDLLQASGTYTTQIVKGEIVLEMFIDGRTITYLNEHGYEDEMLTYSADLKRSYGGSNETAGTFTVSAKVSDLANVWGNTSVPDNSVLDNSVPDNMEKTADGVRLYGKLEKNSRFLYDSTAKGLPIGQYTLEKNSNTTAPAIFHFADQVQVLDISTEANNSNISDEYNTYVTEKKAGNSNYQADFATYYADTDKTKGIIYLGMSASGSGAAALTRSGEDTPPTNKRYGLARITGDLDTGSLTISKEITLNGEENPETYDAEEKFTVKVKFNAPENVPLKPTFSCDEGSETPKWDETSACATLTLKKNEKVTIGNLPLGTDVSVTEDPDARYISSYELKDSQTGETNESFKIEAKKEDSDGVLKNRTVMITNAHQTASLLIEKKVGSSEIWTGDEEYKLDVMLTYACGSENKPLTGTFFCTGTDSVTPAAGKGTITFQADEEETALATEVTLKAGGSLQIQGLPVGTKAVVTEKYNPKNTYTYDVRYTIEGSEGSSEEEYPPQVELDGAGTEKKVTVINKPTDKTIGTLTLSKKVQNFDSEEEFSFTVELTEVKEGVSTFYCYKQTEGSSGQSDYTELKFENGKAEVSLKAKESLTIVGLPVGTQYTVTENADQNRYETKVSQDGGENSQTAARASGSIEKDVTAKVDFTNTYKLGSLTVKKIVEGKDDEDREFSFIVTLTPPTGVKLGDTVPYEQKKTDQETSGSGATSNTEDLKLLPGESEGTYTAEFILKAGEEITLNNLPVGTECVVQETAVPGYTVTYSSTEPVTVAATGSDQASVTVTNTYNPTAVSAAPAVTKQVTGAALPKEQEFTFTLNWKEEGDDVTSSELRETVKVPSGGENFKGSTFTVTVPAEEKTEVQWNCPEDEKLIFTRPGIYKFTVSETEDSVSGFTYDKTTWTWTVTVTDDLNGGLTAKSSYEKDTTDEDGQGPEQIIFVNTYAVTPASYQPAVQKIVNGGEDLAQEGTFTFNLKLHSANPEGGVSLEDGSPLPEMMKVQVTGRGKAEFDTLKFTKAGTYKFTIEEDGTNPLPGYTYDTARWELTVVVEDEDSELVVKSHEYYKLSSTKTSNGETSNGETSNEVAAFTNMYGSADLTVTKQATGEGADPAQKFSFWLQVYTVDGAGNKTPLTGTYEAERTQISGTETVEVELTQTGYTFTLKSGESLEVKGLPRGYRYTVTENQTPEEEQHYEASYQIGGGTYILGTDTGEQVLDHDVQVVFQNENPVPKALAAKVNKKIDGVNAPQQEFTFTLEQKTGETVYVVPQETGETPGNGQTQEQIYQEAQFPMTAAVEGAGEAVFGELYFKKAGVYTFEIKETKPQEVSGGQAQESDPFEYDESVWLWTVTVTKGDDHILTLTETYVKQSGGQEAVLAAEGTWAEFVNRYEAPVGSLTISKTVEEAPASGTSPANEPNTQQPKNEVVGGGVSGGNMQGGSVSGGNVPGSSVSGGNAPGGNVSGGNVSGGNVSGGNSLGSPYTIRGRSPGERRQPVGGRKYPYQSVHA